jgi:SAM-dependent methyltransferase
MCEMDKSDVLWQDLMFSKLADEFVELLEEKSLPGDVELFIRSLRSPSHDRFAILDLACGTGRLLPQLSETGTIVIGLDNSPKLVVRAGIAARLLKNATVICCDMRQLLDLFPQGSFDLVVRAFTSLGYFKEGVEADILAQCRQLVGPSGKLVVDTFNASWFEAVRRPPRTTQLRTFSLVEEYNWDSNCGVIRCIWRYNYHNGTVKEIPFMLDGYNLDRIDKLLRDTGWRREGLFGDLSIAKAVADSESAKAERLVVVAVRAS